MLRLWSSARGFKAKQVLASLGNIYMYKMIAVKYQTLILLTLIMPTSKVISLCHQYRFQASLHICAVWPGSILLADQLQVLVLISLKMVMDSSKNVMWIIPFKKFGMVRVNRKCLLPLTYYFYFHPEINFESW